MPRLSGRRIAAFPGDRAREILGLPEDKLRIVGAPHSRPAIVLHLVAAGEFAASVAVAGSQHRKTIPAPPRDLPVNAAIPP
jgi:hypothetical protein